MIESGVIVRVLEPSALVAIEVWSGGDAALRRLGDALGGPLPALTRSCALDGGWRALRVEPTVWWLSGPLVDAETALQRLQAALSHDGAAADITGAFARIEVEGPAWRDLLMIGGIFDAEAESFGRDSTAGTLLHHVTVRYDVVEGERLHIHVAPSYAADLLHHLRASAARL